MYITRKESCLSNIIMFPKMLQTGFRMDKAGFHYFRHLEEPNENSWTVIESQVCAKKPINLNELYSF